MRKITTFFKKFQQFKKRSFLESACSFYFGLIFGNLFGTLLKNTIVWNGTVFGGMILFLEFLNSLLYQKKTVLLRLLKNVQIGLLLGLLIDAFKVGS
uniref:Ycf20 n=1 Tax=Rhipilia penicilloides TaxID=1979422 RepID=A0A2P0QHQ3_9CHLO|nr:hypothetical protein [Rhipilia penicilloides]ARO74304.1 hypothetical protein [Rhipilia penicilloides]